MPTGHYERTVFKPLVERFLAKVTVTPEPNCWVWNGAATIFGHGQIQKGGTGKDRRKLLTAHRVSWEIARGEIPDGMFVLHTCDNPRCVNPSHLFLGTKAENSADMVSKGRQKRGFDLPQTKLSAADIAKIRKASGSQKEIGKRFNISQSHVCNIRAGRKR